MTPAFGPSCTESRCRNFDNVSIGVIDDEHGGLPYAFPLAVHLRFVCWTSRGDHSEPFFLFEFFCGTPPSCLKVMGRVVGWGVVVAHEILVSAQGPLVLVLGLKGLGLRVWGQGLTILRREVLPS